jgi:uncharacterized protein YjbI with pentapeptide repeats
MVARFRYWWKKIKIHPVNTKLIALLGIAIVLIILIILGYIYNWEWAGLDQYISPSHPQNSDFQRSKTLWDWLQLLIIPLALAIIAILFNRAERKNEQEIAYDNQRETALQEYFDRISELLLEDKLPNLPNAVTILRARTSTVIRSLDPIRRANLIRFLSEADLINQSTNGDLEKIDLQEANLASIKMCKVNLSFANLRGADLSEVDLSEASLFETNFNGAKLNDALFTRADMRGAHLYKAELLVADLSEANLQGVDLSNSGMLRVNLSKADLSNANLSKSFLYGADLSEANLSKANMCTANLGRADLSNANLTGADLLNSYLEDTNLKGAKVTPEQLAKAKSLKGATMPDGSIHP